MKGLLMTPSSQLNSAISAAEAFCHTTQGSLGSLYSECVCVTMRWGLSKDITRGLDLLREYYNDSWLYFKLFIFLPVCMHSLLLALSLKALVVNFVH